MNNTDKLRYFDKHITKILKHNKNKDISFLADELTQKELTDQLGSWPAEIKILIVDNYINELDK